MEMNSKMKALLIEINQKYSAIVDERAKAEGLTGAEFFHLITHHACIILATAARIGVKEDRRDSFIQSVIEQIIDYYNKGANLQTPDMN